MSMTMLTILQLTEIFTVYTVMTIFLPSIIFHRLVAGQRVVVRFMTYFTIGNFYIINLVFLLQLLHISNRYTLWLLTLVPAAAAGIFINNIPIIEIVSGTYEGFYKLLLGQKGLRSFFREFFQWIGRRIRKVVSWLWGLTRFQMIEWLLIIGLTVYLFWIYGSNALHTYGYCASDIPVHNYWINEMGSNQIFVKGVYPFGMHCVIYYFHTTFGIDTYVLLRLFWLVQTVYIHLILFAFIKACCKTRFAPFLGVGIYLTTGIFQPDCTSRFYSTLPQEFGMLFILPGIYFALAFFSERKQEIDSEWIVSKKKKKEKRMERKQYLRSLKIQERIRARLKAVSLSTWCLLGYAMSFSMTLSGHFYGTMIAGFFCVAIALAFSKRFFNRRYFGRVIAAMFLAIFVSALPMMIAYATGTPLESSLNWGMGIINGKEKDQSLAQTETQTEAQTQLQNAGQSSEGKETRQIKENTKYILNEQKDSVITLDDWIQIKAKEVLDEAIYYSQKAYRSVDNIAKFYLVYDKDINFLMIHLIGIGWLFLFAFISLLQKRYDYGATLVSASIYIGFLFFLLGSERMGLPKLMDASRCSIYLAYSLPILWSFIVDAPIYALFGGYRKKWVMYVASLGCFFLVGSDIFLNIPLRKYEVINGLETNEAVTCLTNIIHDNKDFKWTIISANDELNMGEDHGWHTESIQFLRDMEYIGEKAIVTIKTHYVYFFIEKVPIDYTVPYQNSGQHISEEGAEKSLPGGNGLDPYKGENRWVVMSRLYYWAKAYQKMYSNEMKVYYEDDSFVCYQIEQNDYSLNNFAIDYGYNMPKETAE